MAMPNSSASSEKLLPMPSACPVLDREQLRRRLSDNEKLATDSPMPVSFGNAGSELPFVDSANTVLLEQTMHSDGRQTAVEVRRVSGTPRLENESGDNALEAEVTLYEEADGKVRGIVELSTLHQRRPAEVKVRVICLIDFSGSMLLKGDARNRRSKISIMKNIVRDIIDALEDEEDFLGVMTFGETSRVVFPLTRVSPLTRRDVKRKIDDLDADGGFSAVTDLSSALIQAVEMLSLAQQTESLVYRNCIIVFSDGEVNAGETDPVELVHVTREKIREHPLPAALLADLWVNISCVTTGNNFSQALYLLSKLGGSDAYFFVDGSKSYPEADMLIPLMLRKTACAQLISVNVQCLNGAVLETLKCSQEYTVRRRRGRSLQPSTMAYFIHDIPSGVKKTFQIALDLRQTNAPDDVFLSVDIQYVDPLGVVHDVNKSLRRHEILHVQSDEAAAHEAIAKTAIQSLRQVLQTTCRNVGKILENSDNEPTDIKALVAAEVQSGKREVKDLTARVLPKLEGSPQKSVLENFANAIEANLSKLNSLIESNASNGAKCWQYAKAMSSAVARELPTVTNVLAERQLVCPLPEASKAASTRTQALSVYILEGAEEDVQSGARLRSAAQDVARTLADVLKAFESQSN